MEPETIEFWKGREHRLHDRFRFTRDSRATVPRGGSNGSGRSPVDRGRTRVSFRLMHADELRAAVTEWQPRAVEELSNLVRIPSIAFPGYDEKPVRESAEATAETLEAAGYGGVRLIELPDVRAPGGVR